MQFYEPTAVNQEAANSLGTDLTASDVHLYLFEEDKTIILNIYVEMWLQCCDVPKYSEVKLNVWGHVYETRNNLILTNVSGIYIYIFVMYKSSLLIFLL